MEVTKPDATIEDGEIAFGFVVKVDRRINDERAPRLRIDRGGGSAKHVERFEKMVVCGEGGGEVFEEEELFGRFSGATTTGKASYLGAQTLF